MQWIPRLRGRLRGVQGQTMVEYGVLLAVIAIAVLVAASVFGTDLSSLFTSNATQA